MFFIDYTYESSENVFSFLLIMIPRENEMLTGIAFGQNQAPESEIKRALCLTFPRNEIPPYFFFAREKQAQNSKKQDARQFAPSFIDGRKRRSRVLNRSPLSL